MNAIEKISKKLIVSCQALEDEPLFGSEHMAKMAKAAFEGGASGIRANSVVDIKAIKNEVDLPIIGIIKRDYPNSEVRITPTLKEVDELAHEGVDVIAVDATDRIRPDGRTLLEFYNEIKKQYPNQLFMADVSNLEEAIYAFHLGFDIIATTLVGYTSYTQGHDPIETLSKIISEIDAVVIAEGNINQPSKAKTALNLGAHAVVVGSAITRPQLITQTFVKEMKMD